MRNLSVLLFLVIIPSLAFAQLTWTETIVDAGFDGAYSVTAADFDGDGDMDLAGAAFEGDDLAWYENMDGSGETMTKHVITGSFLGAISVFAGDVNNDGVADLIVAGNDADKVLWWENDGSGTTWTSRAISPSYDGAYCVYGEDMDGDGDLDILGAARYDDEITMWENVNNGQVWIEHTVASGFDGAYSVHAADVNGDGFMDILGVARFDNTVAWFENDGDEVFTPHLIEDQYPAPWDVHAGDIDGDGDMDVLSVARYAGEVTWWENDGSGMDWSMHTLTDHLTGASSVMAVDLDLDGDCDVLAAGHGADHVAWWENLNQGELWAGHLIDDAINGPRTADVADIDMDGLPDVIAAASDDDCIKWYKQGYLHPPNGLSLKLLPFVTTIPGTGGQLFYKVYVNNTTGHLQWGNIWTEIETPDGNVYSPLDLRGVTWRRGESTTDLFSQIVPYWGEEGVYTFTMKLGAYNQGVVYTSHDFTFYKGAPTVSEFASWGLNETVYSATTATTDPSVPSEFAMHTAYPNPFNPSTTVAVSLPSTSELTVRVTNVNGREVATLANGTYNAGDHSLNFNAQGLASGLYFIHAHVPGELNQVQKVMLVR